MNQKARKHLSKGVMRVMRTSPFYTTIILKHQMVEDPNTQGMSINGTEIRYNPEAILTQTPEELGEHFKHMAMHIAFKHHVRQAEMKTRNAARFSGQEKKFAQIFDQAADLSINSLLAKENQKLWQTSPMFKEAPQPGSGKFKDFESGDSAEQYFPRVLKLMEEEEQKNPPGEKPPPCNGGQGGQGGNQPGAGGGDDDGDDEEKDEGEEEQDDSNQSSKGSGGKGKGEDDKQEQDVPMNFGMVKPAPQDPGQAEDQADEMIAAAIMAAKEAGEGTGSVQAIIAENEKPVDVDWRAEAAMFFERAIRGRKNYRHMNRRLWGSSIIFPTNKDKAAKKVIFLVDMSGSMSDEAVGAVYNHIEEIIKAKPSLVVELVPFDDGVFKDCVKEYTRDNLPIAKNQRTRMGYGGTRFCPAARFAEDKMKTEDVSGVVMLTDRIPCDVKEFEDFKPALPWLILSVYKFQFGNSGYSCATPKWCKIVEIKP